MYLSKKFYLAVLFQILLQNFANAIITKNPDCKELLDICIVIDASDSISFDDFDNLRFAVSDLIDRLNIGDGNGRLGIIVFSRLIALQTPLSSDKVYLKEQAASLPHPREGTNTGLAIEAMNELFQNQSKAEIPKVGIVITDGLSKDPVETARQARLVKDIGVRMYSVGVSDLTDLAELQTIASSSSNVLTLKSFGSLATNVESVVHLVCPTTTTTTTTTPAPTTTTTMTTPHVTDMTPTPPTTMAPGIGPCDNCKMLNGIGFNPHPDDCDKFVQCYFGPNSQLRVAYRQCPFGQYWDQDYLTCRPSEQVPCSREKCRVPGLMTYPMNHAESCRAHWSCNFGKATAKCCGEGYRYEAYKGCVKDEGCKDPCPPQLHNEGPCDTRMVWNEPGKFEQYVSGLGWEEMPCAPGTHYDCNTCKCSFHTSFLPGKECKSELYIPFDYDVKDKSGRQTHVENINVTLAGNGLGYFDGNARLIIPRFSNIDHYTDLVVKIRYLDYPSKSVHGLVSNGDCCSHSSSMMMVKSLRYLHYMAKTENNKVTTFHLPSIPGNWNEAYYMHDTKKLEGKVNGIGLERWAYGPIKRSQAGLQIGYAKGFPNFRGYMDYVAVFLCRPEYL